MSVAPIHRVLWKIIHKYRAKFSRYRVENLLINYNIPKLGSDNANGLEHDIFEIEVFYRYEPIKKTFQFSDSRSKHFPFYEASQSAMDVLN